MKNKLFFLLFVILVASAFIIIFLKFNNNIKSKVSTEGISESNLQNNIGNTEETKVSYIDNNPVSVGLYVTEDSKRELISECSINWIQKKDMQTFTTIFSQDEQISGDYIQNVFYQYYNKYDQPEQYHIGYHIKFTINDNQVKEQTIRTPKDTEVIYDYLETYMYNGPQKKIGQWYSHVTEEEYNENTILASIKLTAGSLINEITSEIELTVFTYDGTDDFDENGNYRGNSSYTVKINRK